MIKRLEKAKKLINIEYGCDKTVSDYVTTKKRQENRRIQSKDVTRQYQIMLPLEKTRKQANIEYGNDKNKNQNSLRINMRKYRHKTALYFRN